MLRDLLDVHAACGRCDDGDTALLAVQREREIDLAIDFRARFHVHRFDGQSFRPGLFCDQALAKHVGRRGTHGVEIARELDATCLAAASGMHLGLDHPQVAT
jgi:hypothetical protein